MIEFLITLWHAFFAKKQPMPTEPQFEVSPAPLEEPTPMPAPTPVVPKYLFDTPQNARHSIRVICDEEGLSLVPTMLVDGKKYTPKDVMCACIENESHFRNYRLDGGPMIHENFSKKTGKLLSTDWGICQINDTPGWHIGPGLAFKSVDEVMQNPAKAARFMARMTKAGQLDKWVSYTSGAFEQYLPQNGR